MLAWSIDAARASAYVDRLVLSSEDDAIAEVARSAGCDVPFRRPAALATDDASIYEVLKHAATTLPERYDLIVLLQPSSPLREAADIDRGLELLRDAAADSVISVTPAPKPPQWMYTLDRQGCVKPVIPGQSTARRQDVAPVYVVNGALYAASPTWLFERMSFVGERTVAYVMPPERSVDIDTMADFVLAENLMASRVNEAADQPVCG